MAVRQTEKGFQMKMENVSGVLFQLQRKKKKNREV